MEEFTIAALPPRYQSKIEVGPGGCWLWTGCVVRDGYGRVGFGSLKDNSRRSALAHRSVYELLVGPIPDGLVMDHFHCENRRCVNPAHVRPVTMRENTLRSDSASALNLAKTHCVRGHEFTVANTYVRKDRPGHRHCRACRNLWSREARRDGRI